MDLLACYWSDVDNRVQIKYQTSIMFGHAKAPYVVTELLNVIMETGHSSQTYAFSWNGWTKCKQVYTEQNK